MWQKFATYFRMGVDFLRGGEARRRGIFLNPKVTCVALK
jgi:hypothetical protein